MFDTSNPYSPHYDVVAASAEAERTTFIRRTYAHLAVAIAAFVALETVLVASIPATAIREALMSSKWMMLAIFGGFMGISWVASSMANSSTSKGLQYAGLGLYVVAEALFFLPLLAFAVILDPQIPMQAGLITMVVFAGLTAMAFLTKADFSWMGKILCLIGFGVMGLILASIFFPISLGIWFSAAMVVFAGAYILYDTSNVIHHYRTDQYVAASLALFASVALLFWYVIRILSALQRD